MPKIVIGVSSLSAKLQKEVSGLKGTVNKLAKEYGVAREKIGDLAPKVMTLFDRCKGELAGKSFGLADFARMFDSSVPTTADGDEGYRNHKTYYALAYMQRVVRAKAEREAGGRQQGKFNASRAKFERVLVTLLSLVKDPAPVWAAMAQVFAMPERSVAILQNRVELAKGLPILDLSGLVKPINVESAPLGPIAAGPARGAAAEAGEGTKAGDVAAMRGVLDTLHAKGQRVTVTEGGKAKRARAA